MECIFAHPSLSIFEWCDMKVKRMGISEILRRIWLFSANKMKSSESFSKQPTQLIVELNSSLRHIIVTNTNSFLVLFQTEGKCQELKSLIREKPKRKLCNCRKAVL